MDYLQIMENIMNLLIQILSKEALAASLPVSQLWSAEKSPAKRNMIPMGHLLLQQFLPNRKGQILKNTKLKQLKLNRKTNNLQIFFICNILADDHKER